MRYSLQIGWKKLTVANPRSQDLGKGKYAKRICMSLYHFSRELRLVSKNAKVRSDYLSVSLEGRSF